MGSEMCIRDRYCLQVLRDLANYESGGRSSYNRPTPGIVEPPPPIGPRTTLPPRPWLPPVGFATTPPGIPGAPAPRPRRKRSTGVIGPFFHWWPFFSGGTDSYEVFEVYILAVFQINSLLRPHDVSGKICFARVLSFFLDTHTLISQTIE